MNYTMNRLVRTHTYWMTMEEYIEWSVTRISQIDNRIPTRTHIRFIE